MKWLLFFLALTDLISAYFLIKGMVHPLIIVFLWIHSIKGFTSLIGSIASGYYFDWMGVTDILAAIMILLIPLPVIGELSKNIAVYIGIVMAIKGLYSIIYGLF